MLSDADFEKIPIETARKLDIMSFVSAEEIDPIFFESSYYLGPEGGDVKAFELLRAVLSGKKQGCDHKSRLSE